MSSILFTNIKFAERSGTEIATLELAHALRARGHRVAIYSPILGETAMRARMLGIAVTSRIETIGYVPDVIHGNHNVVLALAMVRFPATPAIFTCHDTASPYDEPLLSSRIAHYVAVDAACRDRLLLDGVNSSSISILPNGVDLEQFTIRTDWPQRPRSALLIVKQATGHVALVAEACRLAGIALEVVGPGVGLVVSDLSDRCRRADIVFAHSRSAIEAISVGASVIVIDEFGFGGLFDREQITGWPDTTLSRRVLGPMPKAETLSQLILGYDPAETQAVTDLLRDRVDLSSLVRHWEAIYDQTISQAGQANPLAAPGADTGTLAAFLARYMPRADQIAEAAYAEERLRTQQDNLQSYVQLARLEDGHEHTPIVFHPVSLGRFLLATGWHATEDWGVWSAADRASLWLPETVLSRWDFAFDVTVSRYIPPGTMERKSRTITVLIGTTIVATRYFPPDEPVGPSIRIMVPEAARPQPGQSALVSFLIDRPIAPVEAGDGHDQRRLGVRLTAIEPLDSRNY